MSGRVVALATLTVLMVLVGIAAGCGAPPPMIIGRMGIEGDGTFRHPRGVAVSDHGVAVVDRTGRLQVFALDGTFQSGFRIAPEGSRRGLPVGLTWLANGHIAVADTHQSRIRIYDVAGETVAAFGELGVEPGQFLFPQRIALTAEGDLAITDHGLGRTNRIQILSPDGTSRRAFGGVDPEGGSLVRPVGIVTLPDGGFVVADQRAGLVRYTEEGEFVGKLPGWPQEEGTIVYGLTRAPDGTLYAADLAGHRLVRTAPDGTPTGVLGGLGSEPGRFMEPWDVAWHRGYLYVADMRNHRVQRLDAKRAGWRKP